MGYLYGHLTDRQLRLREVNFPKAFQTCFSSCILWLTDLVTLDKRYGNLESEKICFSQALHPNLSSNPVYSPICPSFSILMASHCQGWDLWLFYLGVNFWLWLHFALGLINHKVHSVLPKSVDSQVYIPIYGRWGPWQSDPWRPCRFTFSFLFFFLEASPWL